VTWAWVYAVAGVPILLSLLAMVAGARLGRLRAVGGWADRVAAHRALVIAAVGAAGFVVPLVVALGTNVPAPSIHDEFSYLLAGDTFSRGRLTNPTHPLWEHFESFHIFHQPTYMSKYPPGQGMALALGQVLVGLPIAGVWLSGALACAAVCWMLYGWLPPRWALVGGVMAVFHTVVLKWGQTYWGGAVAMAGGALVFGGARRLLAPRGIAPGSVAMAGNALLAAVGLVILANSRPFEGLVLTLPLILVGAVGLWRQRSSTCRLLWPAMAILVAGAGWMLYYNWRVTGKPWLLPYGVYERSYEIAPPFLWMPLHSEPAYRHATLRRWFTEYQLPFYTECRSQGGFVRCSWQKLLQLGKEYCPPWMLPLLALPWMWSRRWMRLLIVSLLLLLSAMLSEIIVWAHYAAGALGLLLVLVLTGLRHLRLGRWRCWSGRPLVAGVLACFAVVTVAWFAKWEAAVRDGWQYRRTDLVSILTHDQPASRHLVFVRYAPGHDIHHDWVYNEADLDGARVLWARDMGPARNRQLMDYFKDRQYWVVQVGRKLMRYDPCPPSGDVGAVPALETQASPR